MTDQPPPPTDKKPRRRNAPRKRSATKRATKGDVATSAVEMSTPVVGATDVAGSRPPEGAASSPDVVAAQLDPHPLVDAGDRGDAPADSSPLAKGTAKEAGVKPERDAARSKRANQRHAPAPAQLVNEAASTEASAAATPTPPAQTPTAPFARQAELRPGELIRVPLSVRWRDLDAFNHVNNSKYLSYLEEARLRWMLAMPGMGMDDNVAPVVAASNLNYRRPIEWPGEVVIELFVERIGGSSLTIGHRIVDTNDGGAVYCDGNVVMVWIDRNSGRSAPLPESVRAACR